MKSFSNNSAAFATSRGCTRRRFIAGIGLMAILPMLHAQERGMAPMPDLSPAPVLRLPDADGALVDLTSYRGKVVLVNFWASWCPPCRKELPSLSRLRKLFGKDEFEIFAVNVGEEPETAFDFIGNPNFPVLFDRDSKTMAAWPAKGMPTSLLIDRQGRIAFRALGGREFDAPGIVAIIRQLLKS